MNRRPRHTVARRAMLAAAVCFAVILLPAGATESESKTFTVAVWFVETTPEALAHAEAALGFSLDPTRGRCFLSGAEQAALLAAAVTEEAGRIVGKGSVSFLLGCGHQFKAVEEVRVPHRYEARIDPGDPAGKPRVVPVEFTPRELGLSLHVTNTDGLPAGLLPVHLLLTASRIVGWQSFAPGTTEPVIKTWDLTTDLALPLGRTLVLVNRPHEPFDSSALFPAAKPAPPTVTLLLIHAEGATLSTR